MAKFFRSSQGHLLLLLALGILAYANTFHAPFELDDLESIVENPLLRDLGNFLPGGPGYAFHPRRWVGYLSFALNYRLGGLDVTGYHVLNLAVHLGAAALVYALVRLTFRTPRLAESRLASHAGTAALLAALFFLLHPVQTQAVTYIAQRLTSLATLLYLLALVLYAAARVETKGGRRPWSTPALLGASVAAALLAMHTKEIAFTLPLAAALYEVSFFRETARKRALWLLPLLATLPVLPLRVFAGAGASVGEAVTRFAEPGAGEATLPRLAYLVTQFRVLVTYLRLLILPVGQNLDYDYPVYTTFASPPVVSSFVLLAALFALSLFLHRRSGPTAGAPSWARDPAWRLVSFGLLWFFLTLSVESSVLPISDVIFEHRLYLPSVGPAAVFAAVVLLAGRLPAGPPRGRVAVASLVLAALGTATYQRNHVWGDNVRLWADTVRKSPGKGRPWYNLGTYLTDGGRPAEAIPALQRAVGIAPRNADAWHNLGRAYFMTGRLDDAVRAMTEAVRLKPDMDNAAVNLSAALIDSGRPGEAVPLLERVRERAPDWPEARLNLGLAYLGAGNVAAALQELAFLQRRAPDLAARLAYRLQRASAAFQGP